MAESNIVADLAPLAVSIDLLEPLPGNPHQGDVEAVARSYATFGQRKPVVARRIDGKGVVIAGNTQLAAARKLGWPNLAVVWTDDDDVTAHAFALADNRTAEMGGYDDALLAAMLQSVQDSPDLAAATGFSDADLAALLQSVAPPKARTAPDDVPPARPIAVSVPGDVWLCGPHRVLCGDSTLPTDVEKAMGGGMADLVWTDPPYGVAYVGKTADALVIENDNRTDQRAFLASAFTAAGTGVKPGSPFYCAAPPGPLGTLMRLALSDADWRLHQVLVWVKDVFVLGHSDYHYRHEDILYGWMVGAGRSGRGKHDGSRWHGDNARSTVFEVARPKRSTEHPTMKPVDLIVPMLENSSRPGDTVLDPFGGSGSTLIAAHGTGRKAVLVEKDERYADVICRRFQEHTGIIPVNEATGLEHDFTATDGE